LADAFSLKTTELSDVSEGLTHTFLKNNFNNYNNIAAAIIFQTTESSDASDRHPHKPFKLQITQITLFFGLPHSLNSRH
jgi:hypothetical protein